MGVNYALWLLLSWWEGGPGGDVQERAKRRARKFEKQKILTNKHPLKGGDGGS